MKLLSFLLLVAAPAMVHAQFTFTTNNGTITITGYTGPGGAVAIPATTNGHAVTSIGQLAFYGNPALTNVSLPNSITNIGREAFSDCDYLTGVTLPSGVTSIGDYAFSGCDSLTGITVPASVASIGELAFWCANLTNISVATANLTYASVGGVLFDKAKDTVVEYPLGLTNSTYTLPGSVTSIASLAFYASSLTSMSIPQGVTIGDWAFESCHSLATVTIAANVTSIAPSALYDCPGLRSVYFLGNPPPDNGNLQGDPATVYYLPRTTGWGATWGDAPAVLWNPQVAGFITAGHQFGFNITGPTNAILVVEACTNLANPAWLPVATSTLSSSGAAFFSDPQWTNYPGRYYRFSSP